MHFLSQREIMTRRRQKLTQRQLRGKSSWMTMPHTNAAWIRVHTKTKDEFNLKKVHVWISIVFASLFVIVDHHTFKTAEKKVEREHIELVFL